MEYKDSDTGREIVSIIERYIRIVVVVIIFFIISNPFQLVIFIF